MIFLCHIIYAHILFKSFLWIYFVFYCFYVFEHRLLLFSVISVFLWLMCLIPSCIWLSFEIIIIMLLCLEPNMKERLQAKYYYWWHYWKRNKQLEDGNLPLDYDQSHCPTQSKWCSMTPAVLYVVSETVCYAILFYSNVVAEAVGEYVFLSASTYPVTKSLKLCLISYHANEITIDIS